LTADVPITAQLPNHSRRDPSVDRRPIQSRLRDMQAKILQLLFYLFAVFFDGQNAFEKKIRMIILTQLELKLF